MEYSEAEKLLIKIDTEMEEMLGPIKLINYRGSNAYMWELDHRRWMHPEFKKYMELKQIDIKNAVGINATVNNNYVKN